LGGRLRVGKCAVARPRGGSEKLCQGCESRTRRASREQPTRKTDRVDDRCRKPCARQTLRLTIEEGEIEARVVRDEDRIARESEKATDRRRRGRRSPQLRIPQTGQISDERPARH